jgi:GcrA cell cycle regulator
MAYRVPDHVKSEVRRLWLTGMSTIKIGRELNISKNAVVGIRAREGLPARPSPIKNGNHGRAVAGAQAVTVARAKFSQLSGRGASAERDRRANIKPQPPGPTVSASLTCQYPLWADRPADRLHPQFCGARALIGQSWCAVCRKRVFGKMRDLRDVSP